MFKFIYLLFLLILLSISCNQFLLRTFSHFLLAVRGEAFDVFEVLHSLNHGSESVSGTNQEINVLIRRFRLGIRVFDTDLAQGVVRIWEARIWHYLGQHALQSNSFDLLLLGLLVIVCRSAVFIFASFLPFLLLAAARCLLFFGCCGRLSFCAALRLDELLYLLWVCRDGV